MCTYLMQTRLMENRLMDAWSWERIEEDKRGKETFYCSADDWTHSFMNAGLPASHLWVTPESWKSTPLGDG